VNLKIAVIGSGYVGTTTAAFLANAGHEVCALDVDENKVSKINSGKAPFYEAGLNELISSGISTDSLTATTNYETAITNADIVISCVGTPDLPDGSSNLEYVFSAAKQAAKFLKPGAIYAQKSTVPVGTGRKVIKLLPKTVRYCSNPEFLREGSAVLDTLLFDRIVVGSDNKADAEKLCDLYKTIEKNAESISKISGGIGANELSNHKGSYITTTLESAELIKVTANAFLALKISFANSIAKLCDEADGDINDVMAAVGADKRIGRAFFNAGRGYGGGCFPKDVSGLIGSALEYGVELPIMHAATETNESMAGYIVTKAEKALGDLRGKRIALLGLAFKAGTSDTRKSPAIKTANFMAQAGALISAYDPEAGEEASEDLHKNIALKNSAKECLDAAEIICVATDWPEFTDIKTLKQLAPLAKTVIDAMNCLNKEEAQKLGLNYIGVGR
jgi:UDPglucose 6-dehydrogenase